MQIEPEVLIISNKFDFSTDFVTNKLNQFGVSFLRLNRDDLYDYKIKLDPLEPSLYVAIDAYEYHVSDEKLKSIYYRAPTFLRDIFQESTSAEEQLYYSQWTAFVRSLIVFENANWVNSPVATYKAEMKPYQLYYANKIGFKIPGTLVTNHVEPEILPSPMIAVKSIDTAIINEGEKETFVYTSLLKNCELPNSHYSSPFFLQEGLTPKVDIRITVINDCVIPIKILSPGGISGDWRKHDGTISYQIFDLPLDIKTQCLQLAKGLSLRFCAIDMVEYFGQYYFIEVNPTGEWSWLQTNTGFEFDEIIAKYLAYQHTRL